MRHMLLIACAAAVGATLPAAAQQPPFNPVFDPTPDLGRDPGLNPGPAPLARPQPTQPAPQRGPISLLPRVLAEPDGADLTEDGVDAPADQNAGRDLAAPVAAPVAAALTPADLTPDRAALEAAIPFGGARPTPDAGADEAQDDGGGADPDAADLAPHADAEPGVDAGLDSGLDPSAAAGEEEPDPDVIPPYALISDPQPRPGAVLRVLNQQEGETQTASIQTGDTLTIGALSIRLEACLSGPRPLDAAALVVIRPHDDPQAAPLYAGWMSAAAPSLTTMQHPDYDVWVARCMTES